MDYSNFTKSKMAANVIGAVIGYVMFAYVLRDCIMGHDSTAQALVFLFIAVNCTFRIFSYRKLERIRNSADDESVVARAEKRQSIIITLFSTATAILGLLAFIAIAVAGKRPVALILVFAACAICLCVTLAQSIRNLRRFDSLR